VCLPSAKCVASFELLNDGEDERPKGPN
jgi:hypothetical protein